MLTLHQHARSTTEVIIGRVTGTLSDPDTVLLGRFDVNGRLRFTGRGHPLSSPQRHELTPQLHPPTRRRGGEVAHPWPQPLPARWTGPFYRTEPLPYIRVQPTLVAEITVDTAYEHHRWRHPAHYARARLDLSVYDVPLLQW